MFPRCKVRGCYLTWYGMYIIGVVVEDVEPMPRCEDGWTCSNIQHSERERGRAKRPCRHGRSACPSVTSFSSLPEFNQTWTLFLLTISLSTLPIPQALLLPSA